MFKNLVFQLKAVPAIQTIPVTPVSPISPVTRFTSVIPATTVTQAMLLSSLAVLLAACGGGSSDPSAKSSSAPELLASSADSTSGIHLSDAALTATSYALYVSPYGSDSNPGTATAPLRTIQRAANIVQPSTTVHVAPGTYAETIVSSRNGTASAPIRFVSDQKWSAKIVPVGSSYTMWSVRGAYTEIDGFQLNGSGSSTVRAGIYLNGGNSAVRNSWVHHVATASGCDNRGGAGLVADQSRGGTYNNYEFSANIVHDVGGGCGYIQGIYHSSSGKIYNNLVYATSQGINMGHDDHNILVMNNTLFGNSGYGVYFGGCKEAYNNGCPTSGIRINNNIIYNNGGGIQGPITSEDVGNNVSNNLVYGNRNNFDLASPSASTRTGMVYADPQFVNYVRGGGGNYHLRSTSPAIGKGLLANAPPTDLDGKLRGSVIDLGVYEY